MSIGDPYIFLAKLCVIIAGGGVIVCALVFAHFVREGRQLSTRTQDTPNPTRKDRPVPELLEKWKPEPPTNGGDETPGCIQKFSVLAVGFGLGMMLLLAVPVLAFLAVRSLLS